MDINNALQQPLSRRTILQRAAGGLALASIAGPLAACGSGSSSGGTTAADNVTISAWYDNAALDDAMKELAQLFHESQESITLDVFSKPGEQYASLLKTALVGGAAPDVLSFIGAGNTRDGAHYVKPIGKNLDISRLTPVAKNAVVFENDVWGCPMDQYTLGVFYNPSIFKEHGVEPPKTWDDLKSVCKTLQDGGVAPLTMPSKDILIPYAYYMLAVNSVLGADATELLATGKRKLTEPDLVAAAQLLADLAPYYNEGAAAMGYTEGKALFAQGQTAMIAGGSLDYEVFKQTNPDADLGVFGFPSPTGNYQVTISATNMVYTINKTTKHVPQVEEFIKWLPTDEAQQFVADKLGLSVVEGVVRSGGGDQARIAKELIAAGNPDTVQWTESTALLPTFTAAAESIGLFSGSLDAQTFAENCQKSIVVS